MRILAHVHTYNEAVDGSVEALRAQSHPVDEILIVDNASTMDVGPRHRSDGLTRLKNLKNVGPGGALVTGFRYALEKNFDWMWVLDCDSVPREDSLAKLVRLYESFAPDQQAGIAAISCSQILAPSTNLFQGRLLTPSGPRRPRLDPSGVYFECDSSLWSGSLFRVAAVKEVGFPRCGEEGYWEDLSFDQGDVEFFYRLKKHGYKNLVHAESLIYHHVGQPRQLNLLGRTFVVTNHTPDRRYLFFRNLSFFWFHLYANPNWLGLGLWFSYRFFATVLSIAVFETRPLSKIRACFSGPFDGLRKRMCRRYPSR